MTPADQIREWIEAGGRLYLEAQRFPSNIILLASVADREPRERRALAHLMAIVVRGCQCRSDEHCRNCDLIAEVATILRGDDGTGGD